MNVWCKINLMIEPKTQGGKDYVKLELLCSKKRQMRTFQMHSEIISFFFKLMNESFNELTEYI